jgi:hypothetical protein
MRTITVVASYRTKMSYFLKSQDPLDSPLVTALSEEERGRDGVVGVTLVGAADQGLSYLQHCPLRTSQPQTPLHMATVVSPAALLYEGENTMQALVVCFAAYSLSSLHP